MYMYICIAMYVHVWIDEVKVYINISIYIYVSLLSYIFKQNIKQIFSKSYILARLLQNLRQLKTFRILQTLFKMSSV